MSIQSWELNGNGEPPSRAMTLVPHPQRDSRHGTAGRIASRGEQDVLTRVGESGIVGTVARMQDRPGGGRSEAPGRSPEPVTRLSPVQRWLRGLLIVGCLALAWWALWVFDPRNLPNPALFAVVAVAQILDFLALPGFWHAVWPRRGP